MQATFLSNMRWLSAKIVILAGVSTAGVAEGLAGDVSYYGVVKVQEYQQLPGGIPALLATNAFLFTAFVVNSTNSAVTNAVVDPPGLTPARTLVPSPDGSTLLFQEGFDSQTAFDNAYPSSTALFSPSVYQFTVYGRNDGTTAASVSYLLSGNPPTPNVTNLVAAQAIDSTADFTVKWSNPSGRQLDIVQLLIIDSASNAIYASPAPFTSNAVASSSVAFTLPAYSLPPATWLTGYLAFARPGAPNTTDYPAATGIAALAKATGFPMATRPAPAAPTLEVISPTAGPFRLRFNTETNRFYRVLSMTNVPQPVWEERLYTNASETVVEFEDLASSLAVQTFYRVRVGQ